MKDNNIPRLLSYIARFWAFICIIFLLCTTAVGQQNVDINQSIIMHAEYDVQGNATVSWIPKSGATNYTISSRNGTTGGFSSVTNTEDTFHIIPQPIDPNFELKVRANSNPVAEGYIRLGHRIHVPTQSKNMFIIIESKLYDSLDINLLTMYQNVLAHDLINTTIMIVDENDPVDIIRSEIRSIYDEYGLEYLILLGHVPVPYSGNTAIDGHQPDHSGAWVFDGYYGDINGTYTDQFVNNTGATREANKNVPGDGKFDSNSFTSDVEIAVGRIDFSNLPKLSESELTLTTRYLERNISYRTEGHTATRRAIIDNNFGQAEGFGQGAIKSFHAMMPADSITYSEYRGCINRDYLWTFGAGGGSYQSASGIINTDQLVTDSIQSVFTTIFGSYFGDWDITNNLLRASLARGSALINAWSGRPVWYFHHMAMGASVGDVLLNTQNNNFQYISQFGNRLTHTSLLGDPSLKMFYYSHVNDITIENQMITWSPPISTYDIAGYNVYYAIENQDDYTTQYVPLTDTIITDESISIDAFAGLGEGILISIIIKPVVLEISPSGSYYNEGAGSSVDLLLSSANDPSYNIGIYPNPTSGVIHINNSISHSIIKVYDAIGTMILMKHNTHQIDISGHPPGQYIIDVNGWRNKIIKL